MAEEDLIVLASTLVPFIYAQDSASRYHLFECVSVNYILDGKRDYGA